VTSFLKEGMVGLDDQGVRPLPGNDRLGQYPRRKVTAMPTSARSPRTSPSRSWIKVARLFAAVIALTVVVTLVLIAQANSGGSRKEVISAKATSNISRAVAPTVAAAGADRPITVVGIGDSVTSGSNCACQAFVGLYAAELAAKRGLKTSSVNLGVPGWTSSQLLLSLTRPGAFPDQVAKADILLVTIGANDLVSLEGRLGSGGCATPCYLPVVASVGQNVERIVAAARATRPDHLVTILVTNYWDVFQDGDVGVAKNGEPFEIWSDTLTRAENAQICDGARLAGAICVDLYQPFKGNGSKNPTALLAADGDHPNSAGHHLIASALLAKTPLPIP